jgi:tetratricopeptide (TPR) repeat protein
MTYQTIAHIYNKLEQYKNAISALQKVIKIKPDEYVSYHDIAYAYFTLKQYKKALKILKQLIKLDPNNQQETFNEMGVMYGRINQYNKAKIYYQKSIEKSSKTNYDPYLNLFEISLITKKPFEKYLATEFKQLFKNNKTAMMQYASLLILKLIDTKNYNQEKIEALLSDFRRKYAGLSFVGWHWGLLEKWINTKADFK